MGNNIETLIGLKSFSDEINKLCELRRNKACFNLENKHFLINLEAGNGQSTVTRYAADMLEENKVIHFRGMDKYLEYRIESGKRSDIDRVFEDIAMNAVYDNDFCGVISIDISALAPFYNQPQTVEFLRKVKETGRHTTLIFFLENCRHSKELAQALRGVFRENLIILNANPYTAEELAEIAEKMAGNTFMGCKELFYNAIDMYGAKCVPEIKALVSRYIENPDEFIAEYKNKKGEENHEK